MPFDVGAEKKTSESELDNYLGFQLETHLHVRTRSMEEAKWLMSDDYVLLLFGLFQGK